MIRAGFTTRTIVGVIAGCLWWTTAYAQATDQVTYYHTDAIGSVRMVTNATGAVVQRHDYLPFGEEYPTQAPDRQLFAGKERDQETGFDYFGGRYYANGSGRFTTVDPVLDSTMALVDPQRWNRYAYVRNNPLRFIDPDGRDIWDYFAGLGNAIKSNFTFDVGRETPPNADYELGQFAGDLISIPLGFAEVGKGVGIAGAGLAAEGPSLGTSTIAIVGGSAMVIQGSTAATAGAVNSGIYLMKKTGVGNSDTRATSSETNTQAGAQAQRESIERAQAQHRKNKQPERLRSTKKSQQREDYQNRRIRKLEDVED